MDLAHQLTSRLFQQLTFEDVVDRLPFLLTPHLIVKKNSDSFSECLEIKQGFPMTFKVKNKQDSEKLITRSIAQIRKKRRRILKYTQKRVQLVIYASSRAP